MKIWKITLRVAKSVAFFRKRGARFPKSGKRFPAMRNVSRPDRNVSLPSRPRRQISELAPYELKFVEIWAITVWVAKSAMFSEIGGAFSEIGKTPPAMRNISRPDINVCLPSRAMHQISELTP